MTPRYVREDVERDRYEIALAEENYYARECLTVLWSEPEDGHRDALEDAYDPDDPYDNQRMLGYER